MSTVTWYAFQDPKTKREYYFEPMSNKTTWTLPTSSTPVKTGGAPAGIPASPVSIASRFSAASPTSVKFKDENNQMSSGKRGFGKRGIALTIGTILVLNTLCLGILVKVMYSSSIAELEPISDFKIVPSADTVQLEPVDVGSSEAAEETELPSNDAPVAVEKEVKVIESIQSETSEEDCVDEDLSAKEVHSEKEASTDNSSSDNTISKRLTRDKIVTIITPIIPIIVGYGAARIAIALLTRVALLLFPPAAPIVIVQAAGPLAIIKTFFERFLGRPSPTTIAIKPTLLEKIVNVVAKLLKIK